MNAPKIFDLLLMISLVDQTRYQCDTIEERLRHEMNMIKMEKLTNILMKKYLEEK